MRLGHGLLNGDTVSNRERPSSEKLLSQLYVVDSGSNCIQWLNCPKDD
jgi:hypothetical protein